MLRSLTSASTRRSPLVFLCAGEPSGDAIGGKLMRALRQEHGGPLRFAGIGGQAMQAEGLNAMVEGVEALCVRAERAAAVFGKAIAEHDFRGLPHVDSPQNLLKSLVASKK